MSKNKLSATRQKIVDLYENSKNSSDFYKDKMPFDFMCVNDDCTYLSNYNVRAIGIAWKSSKGYGLFCFDCGYTCKLTHSEIKSIAKKHEKKKVPLTKRLTRHDPEYYDIEEDGFDMVV